MIGVLVRLVLVLLALVICAVAAGAVYSALGNGPSLTRLLPTDLDKPASSDVRREGFSIKPGQSAGAVGDELQRRVLIRSALAFRWELESRHLGDKLQVGDYELSPSMSVQEVVTVFGRGPAVVHGTGLTVVEGWRADQVAQRVEELQLGKAEDFLRLVRAPREQGLTPPDPTATTLEGFLFPETYEFDPKTVTAREMVAAMLRQFDRRAGEGVRRQAATRSLSMLQLLTLASIVEREAQKPDERPLIAGVYLNRLAAGMKLEADPTVQYAVASQGAGSGAYGFWKPELSAQDLKVDSPFNTYRNAGLPPGPICSPGLESLQAAAAPAETKYLFFVARGDGSHAFAETQQEHQANVTKYRRP